MRLFFVLCFFFVAVAPAWPAQITFYLDGAIVEEDAAAVKNTGRLEARLPAAMQPGSLRIKPLGGAIDRVELVPAGKGSRRENELARLVERQEQLNDRLKALETREEIFRAAAKLQSGKAPRKTKANPEPLSAIRQGTDYALAQLEEVYRLRRKTEKELKETATRLAATRKEEGIGDTIARIWLSGRGGTAKVSYLRNDIKWTPRYELRLDGNGAADVTVRADIPPLPKGTSGFVAFRNIADAAGEQPVPLKADSQVYSCRLPVSKEQPGSGAVSSLSFAVTNTSPRIFPQGQATCYWKGEYLGNIPLPCFGPGETREAVVGR